MTNPLARVRGLLARGVEAGTFSGAQAAWTRGGTAAEVAWAGATRARDGAPIDRQTLFDIASLTKPFVASATLRLVARGEIDLGVELGQVVTALAGAAPGRATLEQLLAHEAGFTDWVPLFQEIDDDIRGTTAAESRMLELVLEVPPRAEPGIEAVYSDLGFVVLGRILELVTGDRLEEVVAREVTEPLGLTSIHYRSRAILRSPAAAESEGGRSRTNDEDEHRLSSSARQSPSYGGWHDDETREPSIAATEDCPWRGKVLVGEVHDDNCWAMGGVAGHAGLFATATDVARFGTAWTAALEQGAWLPADLASRAISRRPLGRGLGWDLKSEQGSSAGERMGPRTFGHLGFPGCSLWVDPDRALSVALLSNRVHPTRHNEGIREIRPAFHDALVRALEG